MWTMDAIRGLGATLLVGVLLGALPACGDEEEACPTDTSLTGDELPCTCGGQTVEALPGDGSVCTCSADGEFTCEGGSGDTGSGDTGSGDTGSGDGGASDTAADEVPDTGAPDTGTHDTADTGGGGGEPDTGGGTIDTGTVAACPEDVPLADDDLPCACGEDRVDALPGSAECVCSSDTHAIDCGDR